MREEADPPPPTMLAVLWLVLGGVQLLSGLWGLLVWLLMGVVALLPNAAPLPSEFRVFAVLFPLGAVAQCALASLFIHAAIGGLRGLPSATPRLRRLSWCALILGAIAAAGCTVAFVASQAMGGGRQVPGAVVVFVVAVVLLVLGILSIPPIITIILLRRQSGDRLMGDNAVEG